MSEQNIYIALLAVVAAEAMTLVVLVWRRKVGWRLGLLFGLLMSGVAIWSLAYAFEIATPRLEVKLLWIGVEYLGIVSVPLLVFWFVVEYLGRSDWLTRRNLILSAIFPALTVLFNWTNGYHRLLYRSVALNTSANLPQFDPTYGPWFWINAAYAYVLMATATILLVRAVIRYPQLYRLQAWTMLIGAFAPWVGNAIYIFKLGPAPGLDLTPFAFTITGLAMGWSVVHYRLMDIVPAARDHIIESISDAVIVVDPRNRVVDANPAAEQLLVKRNGQIIGRPLSEVMPPQRGLIAEWRDTTSTLREIKVGTQDKGQVYEMRISSLKNRGIVTGRVILLRDITQSKRAQQERDRAHEHAREALRVKSRILAMVSHDFRTPLSAISGYCDMLQHEVMGPVTEKQAQALQRIQYSTGQLTNLVTNLLDQAKIDEGEITINWGRFKPADLID